MLNLVRWLNNVDTTVIHPVVVATAFHLRFASIHPFIDGNGRMARLLTNAILLSTGYIPVTVGGSEEDIWRQKQHYYGHLVSFTVQHQMGPFLGFVMQGELHSLVQLVQQLDDCDKM